MKVVRINISQAIPGMVVAEDIVNVTGTIIIPRDVMLTDKAITRLRFHMISTLRIYHEESDSDFEQETTSEEKSSLDKLRESEEFYVFSKCFNETVDKLEKNFSVFIKDGNEADTAELLNSVKAMLGICNTGIQVFDLLHCLRHYDDLTYIHSVNVSLICAIMGAWLGYSKANIDTLILCGIFHDIGKLVIPQAIITKPDKLTTEEYDLVKSHTLRGYSVLRNKALNKHIKMAAMMHHERCDGSGYPLAIKGSAIDSFAKIVAIADVYDAMTSARVYRRPVSPFKVIGIFETEGLSLFDTKFVITFIERISNSYLGTMVRLSNGKKGKIVLINKRRYSRPMIQAGDEYIDLANTPGIEIDEIL